MKFTKTEQSVLTYLSTPASLGEIIDYLHGSNPKYICELVRSLVEAGHVTRLAENLYQTNTDGALAPTWAYTRAEGIHHTTTGAHFDLDSDTYERLIAHYRHKTWWNSAHEYSIRKLAQKYYPAKMQGVK